MSKIPENANAHLIGSQEDASYLEGVLLQLRTTAAAMNAVALRTPRLSSAPSVVLPRRDPGFEGVDVGLFWDNIADKWVPYAKLDHSSMVLFPSLAAIAAFIMEPGWEVGAGIEEHVVMEIGDCAELYDDGSVIESDQLSGGHNIYNEGDWYIQATGDHPKAHQ